MNWARMITFTVVLGGWAFALPALAVLPESDQPTTPMKPQSAKSSPIGEFPAETGAEKELEAMLSGPEGQIDLALANWLIVADLPPYKNMTREQYFEMLDAATDHVRGMIEHARRNPLWAVNLTDPSRLAHVFCSTMIALGIDYAEEFKIYSEGPGDALPLYREANNVFIAGLLKTLRGSCVSMPMLYLVIGKRLGLS